MTCQEHRDTWVAFVRGEIAGLERQRIEAHLSHCRSCAAERDEMAWALDAASAWQPELERERLQHLMTRLAPYMERRRPRRTAARLWTVVPIAAAAAFLMALGGVMVALRTDAEPQPIVTATPDVPQEPLALESNLPAVLRAEPAPWLRLVTSADWGGEVVRAGRRVEITIERGFVAASMIGGRRRTLVVHAGASVIEVVGTRFFVDLDAADVTSVGVTQGKVRVRAEVGDAWVVAGEARAVGPNGWTEVAGSSAGAAFLDGAYLVDHEAEVARAWRERRAGKTPMFDLSGVRPHEPEAAASSSEVMAQLERAEELALAGRPRQAAAIYRACATSTATAYEPFRSLCGLELGRLTGFQLDRPADARRVFTKLLATASPEVRWQARLAICELDLQDDPCQAAACLARVSEKGDATLRREAWQLIERWGLADRECP